MTDCNCHQTNNHLLHKRTLNDLAKLAKWLSCFLSTYQYVTFVCMCLSCHVHHLESISTIYSDLNVNEILARSSCEIWIMSDCNSTRTHNHIVYKWALKHLAKLPKWMSCLASTYLYGAFDCMFLSCHVRDSELIHTL